MTDAETAVVMERTRLCPGDDTTHLDGLMRELGVDPDGPEMQEAERRYDGSTKRPCAAGNCTETVAANGSEVLMSVGPLDCNCKARRNHDRIVVLRGEGGWRWRWVASNGRVLCHSEGYQKRAWCVRMAERVAGGRVRVTIEEER